LGRAKAKRWRTRRLARSRQAKGSPINLGAIVLGFLVLACVVGALKSDHPVPGLLFFAMVFGTLSAVVLVCTHI
jgi:hypothetical protein